MNLIPFLLLAAFSPWVGLTGSPRFWDRERGSAVLAAWWPLSEPALSVGRESPDLEMRKRCERATPWTWKADFAAAVLLLHPNERNGLPLANERYAPGYRTHTDSAGIVRVEVATISGVTNEELRHAVIRFANRCGIDTSEEWYFGPNQFHSHPTGWDYVRLRLNGIEIVGRSEGWCGPELMRMQTEWAALRPAQYARGEMPPNVPTWRLQER